VPKARTNGGRTSAFGWLNKPAETVRKDLFLFYTKELRCKTHNALRAKYGVIPIDRLRSRLTHILELDVIYQPVGKYTRGNSGSPNKWERKSHVVNNPIWDLAPKGAYYKAKKLCSLTKLMVSGWQFSRKLLHNLERLSINVWNMSKRHFDGLIHQLRAEKARLLKERPEAPLAFGSLIGNPLSREGEIRCTQHRQCQHKVGVTALRLSTDVDLVRLSLLCTVCDIRRETRMVNAIRNYGFVRVIRPRNLRKE